MASRWSVTRTTPCLPFATEHTRCLARAGLWTKQQSGGNGVGACKRGEAELHVSAQVPNRVLSTSEVGEGLRIQHCVGRSIQNFDGLNTAVVPIQTIDREPMRGWIGESHID